MKLPRLALLLLPALLAACSDHANDAEYRSEAPRFSDIVCRDLATGSSELRSGQPFVATAQISTAGRQLYQATYTWSTTPLDMQHKYTASVVSNDWYESPTDTLVAPAAGTYRLTFKARYKTKGWVDTASGYVQDIDGGKVTYSIPSLQYVDVAAEKTIVVR